MPADGGGQQSLTVTGFDRTDAETVEVDRWVDLARTTLIGESVTRGQLDLIFVGAEEMAEINVAHMGHDGPTDVLSFPLDAPDMTTGEVAEPRMELDFGTLPAEATGPIDAAAPVGRATPHLGDVIICPDIAARQAAEHCGDVEAEFSLLVIHGILHILGHDHAEPAETEIMRGRERHHLAQLGYRHPEST